MINDIPQFEGLSCTINTTEDCNLRCKYCYEINKKPLKIDLDKCYRFIDLVLDDPDPVGVKGTDMEWVYDGRVFDFIGGDSLMNVDLLEDIFKYINTRWGLLENKPVNGWRASLSTNGTLFSRPEVRAFCEKWHENLSLGVSIDGCPEIHDANRVFPDGTGSMAEILKNWDWFRKWFPRESRQTKATCARNTIPWLYKSLKWMHEELGLYWVHQNFIMEDTGCTEEDYKELDHQLELCTEYCLDHSDEIYWSMLDRNNFYIDPNDPKSYEKDEDFYTKGRCGSGCMPTLSIQGNIYPCFRWLPHTQNGGEGAMCVGNVWDGFNHKENFKKVTDGAIRANCTRDPKCLDCIYEKACPYCIGGCYAEFGDFIRTTYICEITKLQCKWTKIYWDEYDRRKNNQIK